MWPRPPMPTMPTFLPGPAFQWRSGDQVVMPAHSRGAVAARSGACGVPDLQGEVFIHDHIGGIAAVVSRRCRPASRCRCPGSRAVLLEYCSRPSRQERTGAAAVDHAADADDIAQLEARDVLADGTDTSDDFMARHGGVAGCPAIPRAPYEVGVADAAVQDLDGDVVDPGSRRSMVSGASAVVGDWAPKALVCMMIPSMKRTSARRESPWACGAGTCGDKPHGDVRMRRRARIA